MYQNYQHDLIQTVFDFTSITMLHTGFIYHEKVLQSIMTNNPNLQHLILTNNRELYPGWGNPPVFDLASLNKLVKNFNLQTLIVKLHNLPVTVKALHSLCDHVKRTKNKPSQLKTIGLFSDTPLKIPWCSILKANNLINHVYCDKEMVQSKILQNWFQRNGRECLYVGEFDHNQLPAWV